MLYEQKTSELNNVNRKTNNYNNNLWCTRNNDSDSNWLGGSNTFYRSMC